MHTIYLFVISSMLLLGCAHTERQPAAVDLAANTAAQLSKTDREAYEKLLHDSLKFFNDHLRHEKSGQYYDAANLRPPEVPKAISSSVAATGMGLVALSVSDSLGQIPDAREKVLQTLRFLAGQGKISDQIYQSNRSQQGWFRHWFNITNGADDLMSVGDGYSVIDTAILVAGAQLAANYFEAAGKDKDKQIRRLADWMLASVNWGSAVKDLDQGLLYLNYGLKDSKPMGQTRVYNEYILAVCMGKAADQKKSQPGPMSEFWKKHYADPQKLPRNTYEGNQVLTDSPKHFLSSFIIQFSTYLCSDVSKNSIYLKDMASAQRADKAWFEKKNQAKYLWGLGAGEVRFRNPKTGATEIYYHADAINDNPHDMVSPHIIAGFLPVYPEGIQDLLAMQRDGVCTNFFEGMNIQWRCNFRDFTLPIPRLQVVDYSSTVLGLSAFHPRIGLGFFQKYAAGSK